MTRHVSILLVQPENCDNIGAVARAMKNTGLHDLRLIAPPAGWKTRSKKMAVSAADIIESSKVFSDIRESIADSHLVIGTTRRTRRFKANCIEFQEALSKIKRTRKASKIVLMFGRESKGLDNVALSHCDWVTAIPASRAYPSLNLAQAVMVTAFSLNFSHPTAPPVTERGRQGDWVRKQELHEVLESLGQTLRLLGYENEGSDLMRRIPATFHAWIKRSGLLHREAQMLKGLFRKIRDAHGSDIKKMEVGHG